MVVARTPRSRLKVALTIDTEPTVALALTDPTRLKPLLDEAVYGEVGGRSQALGFILATLKTYRLTATFFVETLHVRAFGERPMRRHVEAIGLDGHDVELHLHPVWRSWADGEVLPDVPSTDSCAEVPRGELADLFAEGAEQIERWTGNRPKAVRAGNFSASRAVIDASADAGLRYTTHICTAVAPPLEPELRLPGGVHRIGDAIELPVTCFRSPGPGGAKLKPLQINAVSAAEMGAALAALHASGAPVAVIVMHPFDFLKRDDKRFTNMRPDRLVQRRLVALCRYLQENRARFEVTGFAAAAASAPPASAPAIRGAWPRAAARMVANYANDRLS
ncbi:MAG: polysaccharide deacetylase family protein [Sphingomonadaceae bacterium]|nr:polysaccharide deacetylase family protein [Sphingomonadaceae bacterium]